MLSEFYTVKIKAHFEHSVWFGFLGTWFRSCVELDSVAVTEQSLAAWKTFLGLQETPTGQCLQISLSEQLIIHWKKE